jgi:hypothetical protein
VAEAVRETAQAHGVSGSVQHPAVVEVYELAREEGRLRMSVSRAHERLEPTPVLLGVVVE